MKKLALALLILVATASIASATACTRGVNCYCDRVRTNGTTPNPAGGTPLPNIFDSSLIMCEDFEAPTLHDNVNFAGNAPNWGPPYDDSGGVANHDRGHNGYFPRVYSGAGGAVGGCQFAQGTPTSPSLGFTCDVPGFQNCTGVTIWHPQNLWSANNLRPCMTFVKNGEFAAEVASITSPTGVAGGGSGVFDGQQSLAHRVTGGVGNGNEGGIQGTYGFGPGGTQQPRRTFSVTMAMAFPSNLAASEITLDRNTGGQNWKFNEWHPITAGTGGDGIFGFGFGGSMGSTFPFYGFMFSESPGVSFTAACNQSIQNATKPVGTFQCDDVSVIWNKGITTIPGSVYNQLVDWPHGTWACLRGTYTNMGTTGGAMKVTMTPSTGLHAGQEITVFEISNWNMGFTPGLQNRTGGYNWFVWDDFYNGNTFSANGNPTGNFGTTQTTFRYEDNIHITAGPPVSCSQIGFGTSGGGTPPSAPTNLRFASLVAGLLALAGLTAVRAVVSV